MHTTSNTVENLDSSMDMLIFAIFNDLLKNKVKITVPFFIYQYLMQLKSMTACVVVCTKLF